MTIHKRLVALAATGLAVSLPFVAIHLLAKPDDAPITPLQHAVAALANFLGPWGVLAVRLVDFPNAGLRSFNWVLAVGLTFAGAVWIGTCLCAKDRWSRYLTIALWAVFCVVWFGVGLIQIADGLL